ncbi:hypothetical protein L1987_79190 [Smallanthus sonchifolius]|uniref:Uncharacterized protein n=1 Tax=Smallanthus sonchifolius TaxID=185202 RepID=A0ACB8ZFT4_9ASTR|nr:hypothetical protein L1987_79190 [Smallanthus sonchifolius]
MESILERYERYSYTERQLVAPDSTPRNWTLEYNKLKSRAELLQRNHRHYMGEDIESLSMKEIQNLEQQLDTGLKNIRTRKVRMRSSIIFNSLPIIFLDHGFTGTFVLQNQLLHESISELQKKIKEKEKDKTIPQNPHWEQHNYMHHDTTFLMPQPHPALNIGGDYNQAASGGVDGRTNELDLSLQPIYCHLRCFPN